MSSLTGRPIAPKTAKNSEPEKRVRYAWVVCPCCDDNYNDYLCHLCSGTGKVKAELIRVAAGSGSKSGNTTKRTPADAKHSKAVRERDGYECQFPGCGKSFNTSSSGLHAAHYVRRRFRSLRPGFHAHTGNGCCLRHDLGNAAAMCWPHHNMIDSDKALLEQVFRGLFGDEHCNDLRDQEKRSNKRVNRK